MSKHYRLRSGSRNKFLYGPKPNPELTWKYITNDGLQMATSKKQDVPVSPKTKKRASVDLKQFENMEPVEIKNISLNGLLLKRKDSLNQLSCDPSAHIDKTNASGTPRGSSCGSRASFQTSRNGSIVSIEETAWNRHSIGTAASSVSSSSPSSFAFEEKKPLKVADVSYFLNMHE